METLPRSAPNGSDARGALDSIVIGSPVGPIRLAATREALVAVRLPGSGGGRPDHDASPSGNTENAVLNRAARELDAYFAGRLRTFSTPLALEDPPSGDESSELTPSGHAVLSGTPFQREVWRGLLSIPYGERRSYAWLAEKIGRPGAYRAVGAANGRNPLAIVVPCHRVIGADGSLTGYGGGLEAKRWLLDHEAAQADLFAST